jgi:hypothetical protein
MPTLNDANESNLALAASPTPAAGIQRGRGAGAGAAVVGATGARWAMLLLLLLACALRVYRLDYQELRGDEAFGYFFSLRSFADIVDATIRLAEPHPVASYFVQKGWLALAGAGEFALRFVSVWFSVLAVALVYRLGRVLGFRPWAAVLATLFMAVSPYAIWHSQDARMYSMSLALTTATVLLAVTALQRQRWPWVLGYIAVAWLALHTHYYAFFVVLALNLFVIGRAVFVPRTRALLAPWLLWNLILGALYLPWLMTSANILTGYVGNGDSPGFPAMFQRSLAVFAVGESTPPDQRPLWALGAVLLLAAGVVRLAMGDSTQRRNLGLLLLYGGVPLFATWYGAQSRPIFNERYLVAAVPAIYLLMAAAVDGRRFHPPWGRLFDVGAGLLAAVVVVGMLISLSRAFNDPMYSKTRGWRELARAFDRYSAGLAPDVVRIAENFPDPTLWYYYRGPVEHVVLPPQAQDGAGAQASVAALADGGVARILLPVQPAANWDSAGIAPAALAERYALAHAEQVGNWPLQVYAQPTALTAASVQFRNGVQLRGFVAAPAALPPGGLLTVHLDWTGDPAQLTGGEKVSVQLLDAAGQLVAQDDRPLQLTDPAAGATGLATYGMVLPDGLAAGPYRLVAALYDESQSGAPRVLTAGGADLVQLAELTP